MNFAQWLYESQISTPDDLHRPGLDFDSEESRRIARFGFMSMSTFLNKIEEILKEEMASSPNILPGKSHRLARGNVGAIHQNKGTQAVYVRPVTVYVFSDAKDQRRGTADGNDIHINVAHPQQNWRTTLAHELVHVFDPLLIKQRAGKINANYTKAEEDWNKYRSQPIEKTAWRNALALKAADAVPYRDQFLNKQDFLRYLARHGYNFTDQHILDDPKERRKFIKLMVKYYNKRALDVGDGLNLKSPNAYGAVAAERKQYQQNLEKYNKNRSSFIKRMLTNPQKPIPPYDDSEHERQQARAFYGSEKMVHFNPILKKKYQQKQNNVTPYLLTL